MNTRRVNARDLCIQLRDEGVEAQIYSDFPNCVILRHTGALERLEAFQQGPVPCTGFVRAGLCVRIGRSAGNEGLGLLCCTGREILYVGAADGE